jgi:hypothetical protein
MKGKKLNPNFRNTRAESKIIFYFLILFILVSNVLNAQTKKPIKPQCRYNFFQISAGGGFTRPTGWMTDTYNPSGAISLDVTYKPNPEVGLFMENRYSFMNLVDTLGPSTGFGETTIGPRYYFLSKNVRSSFFFEAALGTYVIFTGAYIDKFNNHIASKTDLKFGGNAGVGADFVITDNFYITLKAKYHNIFQVDGLMNYIGAGAELTFRL